MLVSVKVVVLSFVRNLISVVAICCSTTVIGANSSEQVFSINVPAMNAADALNELVFQTGTVLLFPYKETKAVQANAVVGNYLLEQAITILLKDSGLASSYTKNGAIKIYVPVNSHQKNNNEEIEDMKNKKNIAVRNGVLSALVAAVSVNAGAQSVPEDDSQVSQATAVEKIVITGSRIKNTNLTSSSPVTVVGSEEVQIRGITRAEDLINTLPQALSAQSSSSGIGTGTATVNLRGLGADRTLVLVDGKRLPFGSPTSVAADLNQIPSQLIERVEVLTGGASAVYGADAIAGVVNFVMKRDFEGVEINTQASTYYAENDNSAMGQLLESYDEPNPGSKFDGASVDFNIIAGGDLNNGKGNITAYAGYSRDREVRWEDRDISSCPLGLTNSGTEFSCAGSGTQPENTVFSRIGEGAFNLAVDQQTGLLRNYSGETDAYNYVGGNYLQRPRERQTFGTFVRYDISSEAEWFMDYSFTRNNTTAQIAPGGLSLGRTTSINCDNPLLSDDQNAVFCDSSVTYTDADGVLRAPLTIGRRNIEGGARATESTLITNRMITGVRGVVFEDFDYEIFGQYSNVDYTEILVNDVLSEKAELAIDVVTDPATGEPICRSALSGEEPDCLPWNIFQPGAIDPAATDFLTAPSIRTGSTTQQVLGASISGDLERFGLMSPAADSAMQIVFGFEYRKDSLELTPDTSSSTTVVREPVEGEVSVTEFFTEFQIPLVEGKKGFKELVLNGAYRYSDYDTTGSQDTYSSGLTWVPTSDVLIRAQYQRATRSPNPVELFSSQANGRFSMSAGTNGLTDPCAGDFEPATSTPEPARELAECMLTGVTADTYGQILNSSTGEYSTLTGGNVNLQPEKSDTVTVGIVITPEAIPDLSITVDYFDITVEGFVGTVPPELALTKCLDSGDSFFCGLINRDEAGTLWLTDDESYIQATNINTGSLSTKGIDLGAEYSIDIGSYGSLKLNYLATLLNEFEEESLPGEDAFDCAGYYGGSCGTPRPEYRHWASIGWNQDALAMTLTWRHIGTVKQYGSNTSPIIDELEATSYVDLSANYRINDNIELRFGINNILDQDPPLTSIAGFGGSETSGRGNTYPQIYDAQGRYIFTGLKASF
ncbi:TonB-dependent receptor [Colwellia sp. 1_MG-2023]|uniref:TonB-dependent receptor n=1 Tax=unclassified Colwellia TaxID=196834 RepID=UPI001C08E5F6|nr:MULTISPECIES: TonB-dependent receptor [unclassified Colwellia]MBU2926288.1 TonB-dependent receptor [Colwellia sp. C2M11]MDO6651726.1 TonB-dependent receptor [Colwellia sp. 3_MG-2023]MDO6665363.1 TonB-dependent receptor [Colwellia sp. 2_MG-2023]MDO6689736.1 TonB-dependent receptor [Colwellia sp. 1_MG-2023]